MSYTKQWINDLREAGLVDQFGNRLSPGPYHAGDRQPVQGANGDRVNPSDVLGELRFQERKATMNEQPVALWYKGRAYHNHPGWKRYYKEVALDNGDYKPAPIEDGLKVQNWLTSHGYRKMWQGPMQGAAPDFHECWMHIRYAGEPNNPDRFQPKSTAELREYIDLAVASNNEPETVVPELPEQEVTTQPDHMSFDAAVDTLANFVGTLITEQAIAGWLA